MERQLSTETGSPSELRKEDIKTFWKGFLNFKNQNPVLVNDVKEIIIRAMLREHLTVGLTGAVDEAVLFIYGVDLARRSQPGLSERVPSPGLSVTGKTRAFSRLAMDENINSVSTFDAGFTVLFEPETVWNCHVKPWRYDCTGTVSKYIPDKTIVFTVISGFEEYAHELFVRMKDEKACKNAFREYKRIQKEFYDMIASGSIDEAFIHYHTGTIERRGLVWKHRAMEKYFPHWSDPTHELTDKVRSVRYLRYRKIKSNLWRQLLSEIID